MGAGIPKAIPGILDRLADGFDVEMQIDVKGASDKGDPFVRFSPADIAKDLVGKLPRPKFIAIVSSHVLARMLATKSSGEVDGFVVELPVAGGHNAPPRVRGQFNDIGEPIYGERDVQVGTAFAYCNESGFTREVKDEVIIRSREGTVEVFTDAIASPTGFPFKVVQLEDTLSNPRLYEKRERICDLGYLRHAYEKDSGSIGWRCPAEPVDDYLKKGGALEDTVGRKCLCNSLVANVGMPQIKNSGEIEPMLITSGDDATRVARFAPEGGTEYAAADVLDYLLAGINA
jgi:nitronate monooxygenase